MGYSFFKGLFENNSTKNETLADLPQSPSDELFTPTKIFQTVLPPMTRIGQVQSENTEENDDQSVVYFSMSIHEATER